MPQFDVEGARKAGYSDDEILSHLTQSRKFDVDGAVKSGYSKTDIINHLSGYQTAPAPKPTPPPIPESDVIKLPLIGEVSPSGFMSEAKRRTGNLLSVIGDNTQKQDRYTGHMQPEKQEVQTLEVPAVISGAQIGGAWQGARNLPAMMKETPLAQAGKSAVDFVLGMSRNPVRTITQALKPTSTNIKFQADMDLALPEVKAAEEALGRPIEGLDDLMEAIPLAKKRIWGFYESIKGPAGARGVDGSPIADAIVNSIPAKLKLEDPQKAAAIVEAANKYRRSFTVNELDDFMRTTNAELNAYYAKYPAAQRVAKAGNPDTAALEAQAGATRDVINKAIDGLGGGEAPMEIKRRYGALLNLEKETQRRWNVARRQQPNSLAEQMGMLGAVVQGTRGAEKMLGGDVGGGAMDIASGLALRKAGSYIKNRNSADSLIKNVFANYRRTPSPIPFTQRRPAGLLGSGPVVTPPPADTSFVRGVPAEVAVPTRKPLMIPEKAGGPYVTPPPPESLRERLKRMGVSFK